MGKPMPPPDEHVATVTSKGQVTIPVDMRRAMGIEGGGPVSITYSDGVVTLRSARKPTLTDLLAGFDPGRHRHSEEERVWDDGARGKESL
ncbi:MAG TPA: AbrB/MazE/SpoVT family DNA-binding domain-containing protein [Azospirillaceae bacterium]|nr:AbrB/MazE/SpoVT family DNA-binding domain-containing protein [Azospirillaceae bacterium]